MLKNYIKIAFRSFWNRKLSTAINIFGLSFGIACAAIAFLFIQHEWSFNQFHDEAENIYLFNTRIDNEFNTSGTPGPLGASLVENFPEITESTRLNNQTVFIRSGMDVNKEKALLVNPNFFSFFQFSLKEGDMETALIEANSIVISESMAKKYFGRKDPIGETLPTTIDGEETLLKVTGVVEKAPANSSIQFDFLIPIQFAYKNNIAKLEEDWDYFAVGSLIRVREGTDIAKLSESLPAFFDSKFDNGPEEETNYAILMQSFSGYHLSNGISVNGLSKPTDPRYIKILAIIALLILLVACFNFMNLFNAQSSQRLKEVGVRQALGARSRQLMLQFLSESIFISLLSLMVAVLLIITVIPLTETIFDYPLQVEWTNPKVLLTLFSIATLTGLFAGSYPAFLLSRLKTVKAFRSNFKIGGNNWATKSSMTFQFALSIGLLACTAIMFQQQSYISQRNLGYNQDQILVIPTQASHRDKFDTGRFVEQFRQALQSYKGVEKIAGVSNSFNRGNRVQFIFNEEGSREFVFQYGVDPQYLDLLEIELKEGRNFSNDIQEDSKNAVIVNEAFCEKYQVDNINDFRFPTSFGEKFANTRIIGVVKDYHYNHLRSSIKPMFLNMNAENLFEHMLVKIEAKEIQKTLAQLKSTWQELRMDKPFEFYFLDEDLQSQYTSETRWTRILTGASVLSILIAMLGLFGLLALVLAQRTKEIGIRKILGAQLSSIVGLLSKDFLKLIGVALFIAVPVAWYFMSEWLENFAYRIEIKWWVFLITGIAITGIAFLTIFFQVIKAALTNPAESLRTE